MSLSSNCLDHLTRDSHDGPSTMLQILKPISIFHLIFFTHATITIITPPSKHPYSLQPPTLC
ncbi:hypothetical protein M404DRAFT_1002851 [Pisolithus tinctorius Marx 270]|uniref:Uncharacterized protein n=1 Tax=Pisolithus tinctorius Marx 270 TaxID=870435 RepID=A0A0C3P358_PISTI|nr:hypothetical protein M404DRAFT_1002851 [Pisolithus tinctorius Marx 270]